MKPVWRRRNRLAGGNVGAAKPETSKKPATAPAADEVADLKEEMEQMRRQLAELSQRK